MRVRHENGCTFIVDVYEPAEIPDHIMIRRRYFRIVFFALAVASVIGGALAALSH